MKYNTAYNKIVTDETLRETVEHGTRDYPFCFYYDNLGLFDFQCIDWHWHFELEFVYVEEGTVTVFVGEEEVFLKKGQGIFINSRVLHRFSSTDGAVIPNFVFKPTFFDGEESSLYQMYVKPVMESSVRYQVYKEEIPWQREILCFIREICAAQEMSFGRELQTKALCFRMWLQILLNTELPKEEGEKEKTSSYYQAILQLMMQYMHTHYKETITLEQVAKEASISKSSVLNLFQKYLHTTPMNYLLHYRLKQAAEQLRITESSVVVIAKSCGFEHVGYFCRAFKKHYGKTPSEYRKNCDLVIEKNEIV